MNTGYIVPDSVSGNSSGTVSDLLTMNGVSVSTADYMVGYPVDIITAGGYGYFVNASEFPNIWYGNPTKNVFNYYSVTSSGVTAINDYDISHWNNGDKLNLRIATTVYYNIYNMTFNLVLTFPIFSYLPESNKARISGVTTSIYLNPHVESIGGGGYVVSVRLDFAAVSINYDSTSGFFFALG